LTTPNNTAIFSTDTPPASTTPAQQTPTLTPAQPPKGGANLVGTWQSTQDPESIVKYSSDGTTCNIYGTEVSECGTWEWTTLESFPDWKDYPGVTGPLLARTINYAKNDSSTLFYDVDFNGRNELTLVYISGGRVLEFVRKAK
jgi:hypothetical protein